MANGEMYKSEIRDSQKRDLLEKVQKSKYAKYLRTVTLQKARSFSGDKVNFEFPVTALIGPNGGGKSTILGAAACAYKSMRPGAFFPKSSIGDNSMADWSIEFELIDKKLNSNNEIKRSSKFKQLKWVRGDVAERDVAYFGINRTVPAGEKAKFKKLMKPSYNHQGAINKITDSIAVQVERILGKSVKEFRLTNIGEEQDFYIGGNGKLEYSEFHFGAGEASVIRMVSNIEALPDNSMVLIEEIENGLHPIAVRRMVEYLIEVAERKSIQTLFTTHSDCALEPLPSEAIWASIDGKVQQGKLSVETLRAVSGRVDRKLAIFVEDEFAQDWMEAIIREKLGNRLNEIAVYPVAGDGNAVKVHNGHRENPSVSFTSLCYIDGDSQQKADDNKGIYRLPGAQPEATIFNNTQEHLEQRLAVLTVSCQRAPEVQSTVKDAVNNISRTNRDPHVIFNQVGIEIGFVSEIIVKGAFLAIWIRENATAVETILKPIQDVLNTTKSTSH